MIATDAHLDRANLELRTSTVAGIGDTLSEVWKIDIAAELRKLWDRQDLVFSSINRHVKEIERLNVESSELAARVNSTERELAAVRRLGRRAHRVSECSSCGTDSTKASTELDAKQRRDSDSSCTSASPSTPRERGDANFVPGLTALQRQIDELRYELSQRLERGHTRCERPCMKDATSRTYDGLQAVISALDRVGDGFAVMSKETEMHRGPMVPKCAKAVFANVAKGIHADGLTGREASDNSAVSELVWAMQDQMMQKEAARHPAPPRASRTRTSLRTPCAGLSESVGSVAQGAALLRPCSITSNIGSFATFTERIASPRRSEAALPDAQAPPTSTMVPSDTDDRRLPFQPAPSATLAAPGSASPALQEHLAGSWPTPSSPLAAMRGGTSSPNETVEVVEVVGRRATAGTGSQLPRLPVAARTQSPKSSEWFCPPTCVLPSAGAGSALSCSGGFCRPSKLAFVGSCGSSILRSPSRR